LLSYDRYFAVAFLRSFSCDRFFAAILLQAASIHMAGRFSGPRHFRFSLVRSFPIPTAEK